jgi:hypothetical protein
MTSINIFLETIAKTVDNTFVGTLFAGLIITYSGLWLYRKQKKFDIETSRKEKLHDLAVNLLTHINIAVKDYIEQISIYNGSNPAAKIIFNKMESISPDFASRGTSERFNKYIANITETLNDLSTPLALSNRNENEVKILAETIPSLNFLFSTTSTLPTSSLEDLENIRNLVLEYSNNARKVLEKIIKE